MIAPADADHVLAAILSHNGHMEELRSKSDGLSFVAQSDMDHVNAVLLLFVAWLSLLAHGFQTIHILSQR